MKLGVMQSVIPAPDDQERFQIAQRLGFAGIEPIFLRSDLQDKSTARLQGLQQARKKSGLAIPSVCFGGYNGLSAKPKPTDAALAEILTGLEWVGRLGAKVALLPFFFEGELNTTDDFESAVVGLKTLCGRAEPLGITVTYEGTYGSEMCRRLAAAVASPAFGIYFDLANVVWLGMDGPTEILALGKLITQVHIKETRVGPGDCRPGEGRVNYQLSAAALQRIDYKSWLVLETPPGSPEQIGQDSAFARKFFTFA